MNNKQTPTSEDRFDLRDMRVRLTPVLNALPDAVIVIGPDRQIRYVNPAGERILGWTMAEMVGQNVNMFMTSDDRVAHDGHVQRYLDSGEAHVIGRGRNVVARRKTGETFMARLTISESEDQGERIFIGQLRDLSAEENMERMQVEHTEALRVANERLQSTLEALPDVVIAIGTDCCIRYCNAACERTLGWSKAELLGQNVNMLMTDADKFSHDEHVNRYLDTGQARVIGTGREVVAVKRSGETFAARLTISEGWENEERIFIGQLRDIEAEKVVERLRQRHTEELLELNRDLKRSNEDLESFARVASHDLRAPLRGIRVSAEMLAEDLAEHLNDESRELFDLLTSRAHRLDSLLQGLLAYSRVGNDVEAAREINLHDVLDDLRSLLNIPEKMQLVLETNTDTVMFPPIQLHQVLQNLIDNALKHHDREEGQVTVHVHQTPAETVFEVIDDGPGIPPEHHKRVMQVFQTLKRRDVKESSGLGLAIVRKIVERMDSQVEIRSPLTDRGTAFRFAIPNRTGKT